MPIQYRIFESPSYLHIRLSGEVTMEDYFRFFAQVAEDGAFYPALPTLTELGPNARAALSDAGSEKIDEMGEVIARVRGDADYPIAIAGGPPDARSFVSLGQEMVCLASEASVFESVAEAREWLLEEKEVVSSSAGMDAWQGAGNSEVSRRPQRLPS